MLCSFGTTFGHILVIMMQTKDLVKSGCQVTVFTKNVVSPFSILADLDDGLLFVNQKDFTFSVGNYPRKLLKIFC